MAEAENNQKPGNKPPEEKKEEKPKPTTLESVINENSQFIKGAANLAVGAAAIGASYALLGNTGLAIASASPLSGRIVTKLAGKEYTSANFRNDTLAGAVTAPLFVGILNAVTELPRYFGIDGLVNVLGTSLPAYSLAVAGFTLAAIPVFTALTYPIRYLAANRTFKGLGSDFKENYWKNTKRAMLYLGLPGAAAVSAGATLPFLAPYLIPVYFVLGVTYRALMSKEKLNYKKLFNPSTYIPFAANFAEGTGSLIRRGYGAIYGLGSGIRSTIDDLVKSSPKPSAPARPEPVPQSA